MAIRADGSRSPSRTGTGFGILLGDKVYHSHETAYGGKLIQCGHCGHPITGEAKIKKTKSGEKEYVYYRCSHYSKKGHPRIRVAERRLDEQILKLFEKIRIEDRELRAWFLRVLRAKTRDNQRETEAQTTELQRQLTVLRNQQDRLLNLRLMEEIEADTFTAKGTEPRDQIAHLTFRLESADRGRAEPRGPISP